MDPIPTLQKLLNQFDNCIRYLRSEELVDDDQFRELKGLQNEQEPDFLVEILSLFFTDSQKHIIRLYRTLVGPQNVDFKQVEELALSLKGSSLSVGAVKISVLCNFLRDYCDQRNREECFRCVQQLQNQLNLFRSKLQTLLSIEQHIIKAGGSVPSI